jgi:hypothetical protein
MRKLYQIGCFLFFCLLITGQTWAQRVVCGTVRDARAKEGIPGIIISVKGTSIGTSTAADGTFQLAIPHDTITLRITGVGWVEQDKVIATLSATTVLAPIFLKEACNIDFFYSKHVELSFVSGLRYTPLGGKIKFFLPYLIHIRHSVNALRAELSYQLGSANYQRNATLALDNAFTDCDNNVDITTDYQSVQLGARGFSYTRYTAGALYTGKLVSRDIPVYLAAGRLSYLAEGISATKTGVEAGVNYPFFIHLNSSRTRNLELVPTGRIAYWQDYWQFQGSLEAQINRFSAGINFNKLGQYTEINTRIGFKIERRYRAKP